MKKMKKIGVLTSGGDAPGMNAAVRAVVRSGIYHDMEVVAIYRGYEGVLNSTFESMNARSVANILGHGGTMLHSARSDDFNTPEGVQKGVENLRKEGIEGLVCIGGDGTFRGARDLSEAGIPCIGVPATIDNDIASTDYSIGFDTAINTVMEAIDKFRDTSDSHDRCAVIEVMGRYAGYLTLHSGIAGGAEAILTTDFDYDIQRDVIDRINTIHDSGKSNFIVAVAEGVTVYSEGDKKQSVFKIADRIEKETGIETRAAVLAHMQRGGSPSGRDRVLASLFGNHAVALLREGRGNRVVAEKDGKIVDFDIMKALEMTKKIDGHMFQIAKEISI